MKSQLRAIAWAKGWRLKKLAKRLKVRPDEISAWSRGYKYPRERQTEKLCRILECTREELFQVERESDEKEIQTEALDGGEEHHL